MYAVLYTISIRTATIPLERCFLGYLRGDSLLVARCQMVATLFPFFFRLILWGHFALKIFTSCLWNRKVLPGKEKSIGQCFLSVSRAKILEPNEREKWEGEVSPYGKLLLNRKFTIESGGCLLGFLLNCRTFAPLEASEGWAKLSAPLLFMTS